MRNDVKVNWSKKTTTSEIAISAPTQGRYNAARRKLPQGDTLKTKPWLTIGFTLGLLAFAQTNSQAAIAAQTPVISGTRSPSAIFRVNVTSRTIQAVDYQHRSGATMLGFAGTNLMPSANGEAKVESKKGYIAIDVEFSNLQKPTTFGNEYLTYILWAISPEGRAVNLGEALVGGNHRSKLDVTTDLQAFALIVTAEPYYAVREPSDVVVLENVVRADTKGTAEAVKYELMERGGYIPTGYKFDPVVLDAKVPLEFLEARNALRIAQSEGAETYASTSYEHADQLMNTANGYATDKHSPRKLLIATSRDAVQTAEDARALSVKKMDEDRQASERQNAANAQLKLQGQTDDAMRQKEQAQSDAAKAQSDMAANQAASAAAVATAQNEAEQSRLAAERAENDKSVARARLSEQLNSILQTRDSARGLIVSMSDVLFATGKYSLIPDAREKLAKVAGILLAYPGLEIQVGGYTDNVGGDAMNQKLSESRAGSVRDYLVQQGVAANSVSAKGFGNALPVASNDNASGRQQNRRVELLVSGDSIGSPANATTGSLR
jgi:outer membrane protein OmpA-like peptidoglycan-associated protein